MDIMLRYIVVISVFSQKALTPLLHLMKLTPLPEFIVLHLLHYVMTHINTMHYSTTTAERF